MTIGFQWLDKHLQKRIESRFQNRYLINTTRMLTYPPQSFGQHRSIPCSLVPG